MQTGSTAPGKSDGVGFHADVNGVSILDQVKSDDAWSEWKSNLTAFAGKTVTLTFSTDPGPSNSPAFDFALWGNRRIIVTGATTGTAQFAQPLLLKNASAVTRPWDGAGPTSPSEWSDQQGLRSLLVKDEDGYLAGWSARTARSSQPIPLASGAKLLFAAPDGSYILSTDPRISKSVVDVPDTLGKFVRRVTTYKFLGRTVVVTCDFAFAKGGATRVDISSDDPYIAAVYFGAIGPVALRRKVHVPYYGPVWYFNREHVFANVFADFTKSNASDLSESAATYRPLTNGTRNLVRETVYYALSPDLASVLPTPPWAASQQIGELSKRVVYDIFAPVPFRESAAYLRDFQSYGLDSYAVLLHMWQRAGYDVDLPDVLPADAGLGGDGGLRAVSQAAADTGALLALHENYEDFYPEAKSYNAADVAVHSDGSPVPAWKNKTQSYAYKVTAIEKYYSRFSPQIHDAYGTTASIIDVSSSVTPWFHVDYAAESPGAGKFRTGLDARMRLWSFERATHRGPVFGEGANHWYYSGLLDGVEAQSNAGDPAGAYGINTPLLVDFDLLKIHPLQLNHGMGYLERWMEPLGDAPRPPTAAERDRYRLQEIVFGHQGYISPQQTHSLGFVWQETNLLPPITSRIASIPVRSVQYDVSGILSDINAATAARSHYDRVAVTYANGIVVRANASGDTWMGISPELPPGGWSVMGTDINAYSAIREGRRVDYAETPTSYFAGTRPDASSGPADGIVNYGKVATDASLRLKRDGAGMWTLTPFPRNIQFTVRLAAKQIDAAFDSLVVTALDAGNNRVGEAKVKSLKDGWIEFRVNQEPGVTHYQLTGKKESGAGS
jgi:hypothetical protein